MYGIEFLRKKLAAKQSRIRTRYAYYEMKNSMQDFGISTPPKLAYFNSCVGWCGKAVDSLADRLIFREMRNDNYDMNGIFRLNNPDVFFDAGIRAALICACSFVYIRKDEDGFPRLQVIDGYDATGILDQTTNLLTEGYAVLERDAYGQILTEAYFTGEATTVCYSDGAIDVLDHKAGTPLLVPIINRPDAKRPFGHSRISRACMSYVGAALRTIKRSEISAEFYSFPQKYMVGLSADAEFEDKWKSSMSSLLTVTKDEDGEHPVVGQFTQQSMEPHIAQLRMLASLFSGETGLTLDDMGFPSDNPSSAEAIKAAHDTLKITAMRAQRTFGSGFLNVGYTAACLRDDYPYRRSQIYETKPIWEPIFVPDAAAISLIGDGAIKVNQAVPGYFTAETLRDITGIE